MTILYQTVRPQGHPFSGLFLVFFGLALARGAVYGHAGAGHAEAIDTHCQIRSIEAVTNSVQRQTESARSNTAFTGVGVEFYPLGLEPDMSAWCCTRQATWRATRIGPSWMCIILTGD